MRGTSFCGRGTLKSTLVGLPLYEHRGQLPQQALEFPCLCRKCCKITQWSSRAVVAAASCVCAPGRSLLQLRQRLPTPESGRRIRERRGWTGPPRTTCHSLSKCPIPRDFGTYSSPTARSKCAPKQKQGSTLRRGPCTATPRKQPPHRSTAPASGSSPYPIQKSPPSPPRNPGSPWPAPPHTPQPATRATPRPSSSSPSACTLSSASGLGARHRRPGSAPSSP
mmetsp:Transcript_40015/g.89881  ORF Transcript_40015/g.89881 Transcript_40015/m.89881 type:complete len:223 (+) Transcript_40015:95-763(+)